MDALCKIFKICLFKSDACRIVYYPHYHVLVLFEYNWKSILLTRDQEGMLYDEPFYYANEILMFRVDASNQLIVTEVFPKKQSSGISSEVLGFKGLVSGQHLFLLYNDHPKNKKE